MGTKSLSKSVISIHIIEKIQNQYLFIWTYPSISNNLKEFIESRLPLVSKNKFVYFTHSNRWIYILLSGNLLFCLITEDFGFKEYYSICVYFTEKYISTKNPVELVKSFVEIITKGFLPNKENDSLKLFTETTSTDLKKLVLDFGLEIILIYTGLLLKKRIIVYHKNIEEVQSALYLFSQLMKHRKPALYLVPYVISLEKIQGKSFFLAGITKDVSSEENSYDLYINLLSKEIKVSPHAKNVFTMCKIHKEIAVSLVKLAEKEEFTDQEISEESSRKTQDVFNYLQKFVSHKTDRMNMITIESLREKKLHPNMENFIFNLAVAENMMVL